MANKFKKYFLSGIALLAGVTALAGCDDIEAVPADKDYYANIINADGKITNNEIKTLYDALISSGSSNSEKVLTNMLKALSKSYFGSFYDEKDANGNTIIGLKSACSDASKMTEFVSKHSIYNTSFDKTDDAANASKRVQMYYERLVRKINEEFATAFKNSSYQDRSTFREKDWIDATINSGYKISTPETTKEIKVNGNDDYNNVTTYFNENYLDIYGDYIERSILPTLYQRRLTEYYVMQNLPINLGRSSARKISYIKIADSSNSKYTGKMNDLARAYAKLVIKEGKVNSFTFEDLSDMLKGTMRYDSAAQEGTKQKMAYDLYTEAGFDFDGAKTYTVGTDTVTALPETTLGGYFESYSKITDNRDSNDSSAYNDFTNSGAYVKEVGLKIKYDALVATGSVAGDGWYTSSSLSGLTTNIKNRLFKIGVANELDSNDPEYTYGQKVGGDYYLIPETTARSDEYPYLIYEDGATYIVKVEEAVKVSKLSTGTGSYDNIDGKDREAIAYEVCHLISDNDTYAKAAKQYFVDNAQLTFHDDYVYDYFADTFPDLFEAND